METRLFSKRLIASLLALFVGMTSIWAQAGSSEHRSTIFAIGIQDQSYVEFSVQSWRGQDQFICEVGDEFSPRKFPAVLRKHGKWEADGVERVTIRFVTDRYYPRTVLRLARAGAETTEVRLDGQNPHFVTGTQCGSRDGGFFGTFDLDLASLDPGVHAIELRIRDDDKGNGKYSWDAIELIGWASG